MRLTVMAAGAAFAAALIGTEVSARSANSFEFADRNNDGFVSLREFESAQMPGRGSIFFKSDVENDGRLDPAEYAKAQRLVRRSRMGEGKGGDGH